MVMEIRPRYTVNMNVKTVITVHAPFCYLVMIQVIDSVLARFLL